MYTEYESVVPNQTTSDANRPTLVPNQTTPDNNQSGQPTLVPQLIQSGVVPNQAAPDDNQTGLPTPVPQQIQSGADADPSVQIQGKHSFSLAVEYCLNYDILFHSI